jgi:hypothetical protein
VFLYAHNGAKYDMALLTNVLFKRRDIQIDMDSFIELNGGILSITIKNQHGIEFTFRDSMKLLDGSLAQLCKQLKPKYAKLTDHKFKFDDLTAENIHEVELKTEIREYLKHDCLSLCQIMIDFRIQLMENHRIEQDVCDCFTSSTLAKKLYFEKYYHRYTNKKTDRYIYEVNRDLD